MLSTHDAIRLVAAIAAATVLGCGGPFVVFPGGRLSGPETPAPAPWTATTGGVLALETRPDDPYSVNVNYVVKDGAIYIDPAEERRWFAPMRDDPRVRVRIDSTVYPMTAVLAGKPGELPDFPADRYVFRLEPRR